MRTRQNIWLWVLYDFANSIVSIVFFLYFSQWTVIDRGITDLNFNLTFTVAALLLLFTVPLTGTLLDKSLRRISGLRCSTVATAIFYGLCSYAALNNFDNAALIFFTLGLYSYLLSFTFYTPLINEVSTEKTLGKVSGFGIMANYIGQLLGLIIVLPLSNGSINFFGGSARAETLLPAVIIFFILSLPTLILFKEPKRVGVPFSLRNEIGDSWNKTKQLFLYPGVAAFTLCYFLFNDAILTASNNFSIFMEQVWGVSDTTKTYVLLGILVTSALGGLIGGLLADKYGHKKILNYILIGWVIILPLIGLLTNFVLFIIATTLMGFWFGASWSVSRSVMSCIAPNGQSNLAFAYFGLVERASSFVGPIVWGVIATNLVSYGSYRYRIAVLAITIFVFLSIFALRKVKYENLGKV
jgi:MFS transporter, UMF1 family